MSLFRSVDLPQSLRLLLHSQCNGSCRPLFHVTQLRLSSSLPITPICPSPACPCAPTPAAPLDAHGKKLEINQSIPLANTLAQFSHQVLICTGRDDWPSRIDDPKLVGSQGLASEMRKALIHRMGQLLGKNANYIPPAISILNTSMPSSSSNDMASGVVSAYILPQFAYIPHISMSTATDEAAQDTHIEGASSPQQVVNRYLFPAKEEEEDGRISRTDCSGDLMILICGHHNRDARCGVYGPILQQEFIRALERAGIEVDTHAREVEVAEIKASSRRRARVAVTSHIGGHQFAGNVGIWIPGSWEADERKQHSLAGVGIWYGRIEPRHVEGIVHETVLGGRVIGALFRGGVNRESKPLRARTEGSFADMTIS